jgi:hypothetical protein
MTDPLPASCGTILTGVAEAAGAVAEAARGVAGCDALDRADEQPVPIAIETDKASKHATRTSEVAGRMRGATLPFSL